MQSALDVVVALQNGERGPLRFKPKTAAPELELFPLCSAAGFDKYNFGH